MAGDTNYTLYYNVLDYFKTIMKNHPSINFVSQGDVFSVDTKEFPQYPLGNVLITNATFDGKSTDYAVQLIVADKTKLKGNESSGSFNELTNTFEGVDDTVDVHANTLSILNDLVSWTERKEEGFEITSTIGCTAFKERFDNGLAGWTADFTLRVHNDRNICLFDLSPISGYELQNCVTSASLFVTMGEDIPEGSGSLKWNDTCYSIGDVVLLEEDAYDKLNLIATEYYTDCEECVNCWRWSPSALLGNPLIDYVDCDGNPQQVLYLDTPGYVCAQTEPTSPSIPSFGKGALCGTNVP